MGRLMDGADSEAFRAVITTTYEGNPDHPDEHYHEDHCYTLYAGPYRSASVAKATITREQREASWHNAGASGSWRPRRKTVAGYIERSSTTWERVE